MSYWTKHHVNKKHRDANVRGIFYYAVFFPVVEVLSAVSIGLIVWYGGQGILEGKDITIGELVAFILFIYMMFSPIRQLADRFNILQMGIVGAERVFNILDTDEKIEDSGNDKIDIEDCSITYKNVNLSYNNKEWILKNLNFDIESGKMLALTGRTGAGKTSIVNVLNRFYEINSGSITVGKKDINEISIANLRENIALVQQEVFLFSDTLYNNITLFENNISKEDVMIAAKEIGIDAFISSLPNGLDYIVAERGVSLSAGQRQLIAFLRVYVRNPKILILDEATASIDSETENLLQSALMKISNNRTTIVIAHRLSTVVNSDKILYLENGSVLESGSHQELLDAKGLYAKAFNSQVEKKF